MKLCIVCGAEELLIYQVTKTKYSSSWPPAVDQQFLQTTAKYVILMFCSLNIPYLLFGSSMGRHWCWRWKLFVDVIGWCHLSTHGSDRGHWSAHCFYNIHQAEVISTHMSLLHVMCLLYQLWKVDDVCSMQHESPSSCYPSHYNVWNLISKKNLPCFPLLCTIHCKNKKMCVSGGGGVPIVHDYEMSFLLWFCVCMTMVLPLFTQSSLLANSASVVVRWWR